MKYVFSRATAFGANLKTLYLTYFIWLHQVEVHIPTPAAINKTLGALISLIRLSICPEIPRHKYQRIKWHNYPWEISMRWNRYAWVDRLRFGFLMLGEGQERSFKAKMSKATTISLSVIQTFSQSVSQLVSQSAGRSVGHSVGRSVGRHYTKCSYASIHFFAMLCL